MSDLRSGVKKTLEGQDGHARRQLAKRAEILTAAREVFFRKGYARTSMDDIQQAVGGSKRTLYRHFAAKEELYAALIGEVAERVVPDDPTQFSDDLVRDLRTIGKQYLTILLCPETLELFRGVIAEAPHLPGLADLFFRNGPGPLVQAIQDRLEIAAATGRWTVAMPRVAAQQFNGMLRANVHDVALIQGLIPSGADIDQCVENAIETLLYGAVHSAGHRRTPKNKD